MLNLIDKQRFIDYTLAKNKNTLQDILNGSLH